MKKISIFYYFFTYISTHKLFCFRVAFHCLWMSYHTLGSILPLHALNYQIHYIRPAVSSTAQLEKFLADFAVFV